MNAVNSLGFYKTKEDPLASYIGFIIDQYQRNAKTLIDEKGLFKMIGVSKQEVSSVEGLKKLLKQKGLDKIIFQ